MVRHVITAWYVLVAVLAPKTCCCAFRSAVEAKPHRTEAVAHAQVRSKGCPFCHAADGKRPTTPDGSKPTGGPDKPGCPCRDGHSVDALAVVTAPVAQQLTGPDGTASYPANHDFDRLPAPTLAAVSGPAAATRAGPFLTADDLLRAFHFLRC
jgi:hypothetical protein